jgi:hypothetical protein
MIWDWGFPPDPDWENLRRVRTGLRQPGYDGVRMECYNRAEALYIWQHLTPEERQRVSFRWLTFGLADQDQPLTEGT